MLNHRIQHHLKNLANNAAVLAEMLDQVGTPEASTPAFAAKFAKLRLALAPDFEAALEGLSTVWGDGYALGLTAYPESPDTTEKTQMSYLTATPDTRLSHKAMGNLIDKQCSSMSPDIRAWCLSGVPLTLLDGTTYRVNGSAPVTRSAPARDAAPPPEAPRPIRVSEERELDSRDDARASSEELAKSIDDAVRAGAFLLRADGDHASADIANTAFRAVYEEQLERAEYGDDQEPGDGASIADLAAYAVRRSNETPQEAA